MSEHWRRIADFRRPISRLILFVTADAEIEFRSGRTVVDQLSLSAGESWTTVSAIPLPYLRRPFSVWLRSDDPNCQCQIQAEYREEVTDLPSRLDMRLLYGPMGLGIPMMAFSISRNPLDYLLRPTPAVPPPSLTPPRVVIEQTTPEQPKVEKPCPGVTRLQAFKRELEEEKPKKKRKRGEKQW